jgi:hypothetical protein
MKEMSLREVAKVSGGWWWGDYSGDDRQRDVYWVHGTRNPEYYDPNWDDFFGNAGDSTGEYSGGGSTWEDSSPQATTCDAQIDNVAVMVAGEMGLVTTAYERGAILYLDPNTGVVEATPLSVSVGTIVGGQPQLDFGAALQWLSSNGISASNILGLIHHHVGGDSLTDAIERYPVDEELGDRKGDWESLQSLANMVQAAGGNGSLMRTYIVDSVFSVREYHLADRAKYEALTDDEKVRGVLRPTPLANRSEC